MSSSDLPDGEDPAPATVLSSTVDFLNAGGNLGTLLQGAIFGTLVSVATGGINIIQSTVGLVVAPIDALAESVGAFVESTILAPLGIIETTADASAVATADQFGPFAVLVGTGLVLGSFWLIVQFLEEDETSDIIAVPGFPDAPDFGGLLQVGVEEESEDDN